MAVYFDPAATVLILESVSSVALVSVSAPVDEFTSPKLAVTCIGPVGASLVAPNRSGSTKASPGATCVPVDGPMKPTTSPLLSAKETVVHVGGLNCACSVMLLAC